MTIIALFETRIALYAIYSCAIIDSRYVVGIIDTLTRIFWLGALLNVLTRGQRNIL